MGNSIVVPAVVGRRLAVMDSYLRERSEQFISNTPVPSKLNINGYLKELHIGLDGDIVVSGGAASGTATGRENPEAIVDRIRVTAEPKGEIFNLDTRGILYWRQFDYGRASLEADISGAAATYPRNMEFIIPFSLPSLRKPFETALHTRLYDILTVEIICADQTRILTGNDRTWNFGGLRLNIEADRDLASVPKAPELDNHLLRQFQVRRPVTAATTEFPLALPGGFLYHEILLTVEVDNALADTVINGVEVKAGGNQWYQARSPQIKRAQRKRFADAAVTDVGLYHIPLSREGMVSRMADGRGYVEVEMMLDVSNPGGVIFVNAYNRCVIPNTNLFA